MKIQKKCPNCGALISSLSLKCLECGYVFSIESESSEVAREAIERLQNMLKDIEQSSTEVSKKNIAKAKATIITTFVVPNTKEAMINFLILAYSNIESSSGTHDRVITMAWEAKAISTYNLLKLQQDSDSQIDAVLKKYSILEDSKRLAKIDGRAKRRNIIVASLLAILVILSIPFVLRVVKDPILVAIKAGRYDEAINMINNEEKLGHSVDFYIDRLAASPISIGYWLEDDDSVTNIRTVTHIYKDGYKSILKFNYLDVFKNYEHVFYNPDGSINFYIVDTLKLGESLWSIAESESNIIIEDLYLADDLKVHFDRRGRCDVLNYTVDGDKKTCYFKYNEQGIIVQQDIKYKNETQRIISSVSSDNDGATVCYDQMTTNSKGSDKDIFSTSMMRTFDNTHSLYSLTKYWRVFGKTYIFESQLREKLNRLSVFTTEKMPPETLLELDFSSGPLVDSKTIKDLESRKGVILDYSLLMKGDDE